MEFERKAQEMKCPVFYISSRGSSATRWISKVLSMHPDIVCFHGSRGMPPAPTGAVEEMCPDEFMEALITCSHACQNQKVFGAIHGFHGVTAMEAVKNRGGMFAAIIRHPVKRIHSNFILAHGKNFLGQNGDSKKASLDFYRHVKESGLDHVNPRMVDGELVLNQVEKDFYYFCTSFIYFDKGMR